MAIPSGMFGLATLARRAGWQCEMLHLGLEQILNPEHRLEDELGRSVPRVVAFDLMWHPQLAEVLESARRVKRALPETRVLLGGLTASWFWREILEQCPWVDLIIRGDAEEPLSRLLAELASPAPDLARVPNLCRRESNRVVESPIDFVATRDVLDAAEIDLDLLRHREHYDGAIEHPAPEGSRDPLWGNPRSFHVLVGRGCSRSCAYCGGAAPALASAFGRSSVVWRSASSVERELRYLVDRRFHTLYFAFDPPGSTALYQELFERVTAGGSLPAALLEQYDGLPTRELLESFARAFGERTVVLSPGSAVPELRARHRAFNPSNAAVEEALRRVRDSGARALVYFTLFPDDSVETLRSTASWMAELGDRFSADLQLVTIEVEPGAAWWSEPERFGVELRRRSFEDFVRHSASGDPNDLGYVVRDEEAKRRILSEVIQPLIARPAAEPMGATPC